MTSLKSHHHGSEVLLARSFWLIAAFSLVEFGGGILSNSLTLIADAGHMALDAGALGLAWCAQRLSRRPAGGRFTYGYHRVQVLAAFLNGLMLLALIVWILLEAWERFHAPQAMAPLPALAVASVGLVVNLIAYRWLGHGKDNINMQAAALHVLGDLLGSVAAIAAALTVHFTGWMQADPLLALVVAAILARSTWRVLGTSGHILMEGAPASLRQEDVSESLAAVPGVQGVHHVHVWGLTPEHPLVTLHAQVEEAANPYTVTKQLKNVLLERFGVAHSAIQIELDECLDARGARPSQE